MEQYLNAARENEPLLTRPVVLVLIGLAIVILSLCYADLPEEWWMLPSALILGFFLSGLGIILGLTRS